MKPGFPRTSLATATLALSLHLVPFAQLGAQDLAVVAFDSNSMGGFYAWSPEEGWSPDPIIPGSLLPHSLGSAFNTPGGAASGGFGCSLHLSNGPVTFGCNSGSCGGVPEFSQANGNASTEAIAANDQYVFSFTQGTAGTLRGSRLDTFSGTTMSFIVNLARPAIGDVHDAMINGDVIDVTIRYVTGSTQVSSVARVRLDGTLEREFSLGNFFIGSATLDPDSGLYYAIEGPSAGGALRIAEYSPDWQRLRAVTSPGSVGFFEESITVIDGEIITFESVAPFRLLRFSIAGSMVGEVEPPPGKAFISSFHRRDCVPDDTKALIGPDGRLELSGTVTDFQGNVKPMRFPPRSSPDSVEAFVFDPNNREGLFKALDACALNDNIWFFGALATTTEFALTVRDRITGATRTYTNPAGNRARAIEDTGSFPCS